MVLGKAVPSSTPTHSSAAEKGTIKRFATKLCRMSELVKHGKHVANAYISCICEGHTLLQAYA